MNSIKRVKVLSIKKKLGTLILSLGVFSIFGGSPEINANIEEKDVILTQDMGQQIINERILSNEDGMSDSDMMYHYSHRSHSSHYSHRSHSSHYSSYY